MTSILDSGPSQDFDKTRARAMLVVLALLGGLGALIFIAAQFVEGFVFVLVLLRLPVLLFWLFVGVRAYQAGQESTLIGVQLWLVGIAALSLTIGAGFAFVILAAVLPVAAEGAGLTAMSLIATALLTGIWAYLGGRLSRGLRDGIQKRLAGATTILLMLGLVWPVPDWIYSYVMGPPDATPQWQWLQTLRVTALAAGIVTGGVTVLQRAREPGSS
jgi:hypothetical protein